MSNLFRDLEFVREYIDDLLITTNGLLQDHLEKVEQVLKRLRKTGLKVNASKSKFCRAEVEYLGYLITREGIKPQAKKVQALHNMATPKTRRDLRKFLGLLNYYRDMTLRRSHTIAPLTKLTSKKVPFVWKEVHQKAFERIKIVLSKETLLRYPNFSKEFKIIGRIVETDLTNTEILGSLIYTEYFLQFQMAGFILLVAMIGAIVLTLRHRDYVRRQNIHDQVSRNPNTSIELVDIKLKTRK